MRIADIKSEDFVLETLSRTAWAWCGRSNKLCICWGALRPLLPICSSLTGLCWLPKPTACAGDSKVMMEITLLSVLSFFCCNCFPLHLSLQLFGQRPSVNCAEDSVRLLRVVCKTFWWSLNIKVCLASGQLSSPGPSLFSKPPCTSNQA